MRGETEGEKEKEASGGEGEGSEWRRNRGVHWAMYGELGRRIAVMSTHSHRRENHEGQASLRPALSQITSLLSSYEDDRRRERGEGRERGEEKGNVHLPTVVSHISKRMRVLLSHYSLLCLQQQLPLLPLLLRPPSPPLPPPYLSLRPLSAQTDR